HAGRSPVRRDDQHHRRDHASGGDAGLDVHRIDGDDHRQVRRHGRDVGLLVGHQQSRLEHGPEPVHQAGVDRHGAQSFRLCERRLGLVQVHRQWAAHRPEPQRLDDQRLSDRDEEVVHSHGHHLRQRRNNERLDGLDHIHLDRDVTSGMWPSLVERHRRLREQSDRGFTMLEMVVGMTLMMIFLSIFTTAIISMFDSTNKSQAVNNGSAQLNIAFGRLDRTIRYASFVSQQSVGGDGNWYVTFQTTNTGTPVCTQLRIDKTAQRLQQRTWNVSGTAPNTTASGLTGWTQLASGITNGCAAVGSPYQPFTLTPAGSAVTSESLNLHLLALDGSGRTATTSLSTVT